MKEGGGFLPRLNIRLRPISYKYCEGKVKRTLKRESNRARNHSDGNLCLLHKREASLSGGVECWDSVAPGGDVWTPCPWGGCLGTPSRRCKQKKEGERTKPGTGGAQRGVPDRLVVSAWWLGCGVECGARYLCGCAPLLGGGHPAPMQD